MKKIGFLLIGLLISAFGTAQEKDDDFSNFMKDELKDFDKFLDDANKEFIQFLRNPWKEFEAEKPVVKRVEPEPEKPVVYDEKTAPRNPEPVCLGIEEILEQTTTEGGQRPVVKVNDVDDISFDDPVVIVRKKDDPVVVVVEEPVQEPAEPAKQPVQEQPVQEQPVQQPETKPEQPAQEPVTRPVTQPITQPVTPAEPKAEPVVEPKAEPAVEPKPKTEPVAVPTTGQPRQEEFTLPSIPLYKGGTGRMQVAYGGRTLYVSGALKGKCRLANLKEKAVADAYETMCKSDYKSLIQELQQAKKDLQLNDWGVFKLVEAVASAGCSNANEGIVMQQFLLNEMGYKAKMARKADENRMLLFVATDCAIYAHPYFTQNGQNYYCLNLDKPCQFYMCQQDAPKAKNSVKMRLEASPRLTGDWADAVRRTPDGSVSVSLGVPKALMEFYNAYPQCDYSVYVTASVQKEVESRLLSALTPVIRGKSETQAAQILLNFVQTAFQYATDDEQFGYEKPFFVEELFYYPYCDCEDRSILYSYLVKHLLGLDVVLLDYPDHIATAVCFNEQAGGDYLMVNGRKYTVCDPTYIGAGIGMAMPQYKTVAAKVLKY